MYGDEAIHDQQAVAAAGVRQALAAAAPDERRVLVAHAFVAGGLESESERPLSVGGAQQVPAGVLDGFDYVALGHLHRPQTCGSETTRYAGSLLKYSFAEPAHDKSVCVVEIGPRGSAPGEAGGRPRRGHRRDRRAQPAPRRPPPRGHAGGAARARRRGPAPRRLHPGLAHRRRRPLRPHRPAALRVSQRARHRAPGLRAPRRRGTGQAASRVGRRRRPLRVVLRLRHRRRARGRAPRGPHQRPRRPRARAPGGPRVRPLRVVMEAFGPYAGAADAGLRGTAGGQLLPHHRPHGLGQDHRPRRHVVRALRRHQRRARERGRALGRLHAQRPRRPRPAHPGDVRLRPRRRPLPHRPRAGAGATQAQGRRRHRPRPVGHAVAAAPGRRGPRGGRRASRDRVVQGQRQVRGPAGVPRRAVPPGGHAAAGSLPEAPRRRLQRARADPPGAVRHRPLLRHRGRSSRERPRG